eukprot:gene18261-7321_t
MAPRAAAALLCAAAPAARGLARRDAARNVTLYPDKDTRITRGHGDRNDGWHTRLHEQKWSGGHGKLKVL